MIHCAPCIPRLWIRAGGLGSARLLTDRFRWTERGICSNFRVVPNATRNAGQNNPGKADTLPFEEALKKLETIVQAMESEELPLETLLRKYAEGTHLAKVCQDKLAEAELKIQQLEKNTAGEMKLKPLPMNEQTE